MPYCVRKCRLSDLNFFPSSKQTRYSGVIERFIGTAGLSGSAGAATCAPFETRINAEYIWLIRAGISALDTVLLLT